MTTKSYVKKGESIRAVQWIGGEPTTELTELIGQRGRFNAVTGRLDLGSGWYARPTDWIFSASGEDIGVIGDELFQRIYDEVDEAGRPVPTDNDVTREPKHQARRALWTLGELRAHLAAVVDALAVDQDLYVSPLDVALELIGGELEAFVLIGRMNHLNPPRVGVLQRKSADPEIDVRIRETAQQWAIARCPIEERRHGGPPPRQPVPSAPSRPTGASMGMTPPTVTLYAKKRDAVRAVQWRGDLTALTELVSQRAYYVNTDTGRLDLGDGWFARPSDWIVSASGEDLFVIGDEAFRRIYEEVDEAGRAVPPAVEPAAAGPDLRREAAR